MKSALETSTDIPICSLPIHAAYGGHQHKSMLNHSALFAQVSRIDLPPMATDRVLGDSMLELELLQLGGQLSGTLAYNIGLFKESTAERFASQYQVCKPSSAVVHLHDNGQTWTALLWER